MEQVEVEVALPNVEEDTVKRKTKILYKKLESLYGTQGLILRASKLDAIDMLNSNSLPEKLLAIQRILSENPGVKELKFGSNLAKETAYLEELLIEQSAKKAIEEDLQQRIQEKMNEKYNEYVRDIKLQILKGTKHTPENAHTLKRLAALEKMEQVSLSRSALELLRPGSLDEVIGQDKAIKSLLSKLNTPFPQHILFYGPPGVGKTTCARLALKLVKQKKENPFNENAPFIEVDGTTLRWDPRESTNPLIGSVHDPIYQGAKKDLAEEGIPEPKPGLVSEAHGGILFIDEIGEMDPLLQNKLLKVLEDKRVYFESSYYDPHDERIPQYIKNIFEKGLPADFILIGATTRDREEISPALRSRCMEIFFDPLNAAHIQKIIKMSALKLGIHLESGVEEVIADYATDGRAANKVLVDAYAIALNEKPEQKSIIVTGVHVNEAIQNSRLHPSIYCKASNDPEVGRVLGIGASRYRGVLLEIEASAFKAPNGEGRIRFNETAGSMVRDSVFNAASLLRKETGENMSDYNLHINFIGGGQVDGPSAGAAVYLAILSAIKNRPVRQDVAVTGEISIQGRIKPVGAIHEKIQGAKLAGIKKLIIPYDNSIDILNESRGIEIIGIKSISEAYPHIFWG